MNNISPCFCASVVRNISRHPCRMAYKGHVFTVLGDPAMKLVPVRINMADLQMKNRTDWIIIWFPPSEGLRKALDGIFNIDDCLLSPSQMKQVSK